MATVKKFTELEVWQLANQLQLKVFSVSSTALLKNDFALKDQMNRSSGSIADNIAEGFGRGGRLEFIQFLTIARASASELQSQLIRTLSRKYISQEVYDELSELADKTGSKIGAFIKYLNKSDLKGPKFLGRNNNLKQLTDQKTIEKQEMIRDINQVDQTVSVQNEKRKTRNCSNEKLETRNGSNAKQETRNSFEKPQTPNLINTVKAATPLGTYPHARRFGDLLFLSGIGSRQASDNKIPGLELDADGNIIKYDIEAECHSVFANVKAVLEASGSSWDKIIDVTVFLTNMKTDFPVYNKVYATYFQDVQACRTTVEVKSLPTPIAIELKVIATI